MNLKRISKAAIPYMIGIAFGFSLVFGSLIWISYRYLPWCCAMNQGVVNYRGVR